MQLIADHIKEYVSHSIFQTDPKDSFLLSAKKFTPVFHILTSYCNIVPVYVSVFRYDQNQCPFEDFQFSVKKNFRTHFIVSR